MESKAGTIVAVIDGCQRVDCDDGTVHWLLGIDRLEYAQVGERVLLTYVSTKAYGLWFPKRIGTVPEPVGATTPPGEGSGKAPARAKRPRRN